MSKLDEKNKDDSFLKNRVSGELKVSNFSNLRVENPPIPKTLLIDLCNGCNHECIFCMNRFMTRQVTRMPHELFSKIIDQARAMGVEELGLYATGEPFMHTYLERFVKEAKDKGFRYVYISTNGALVGHKRLQKVLDAGLDSIKFSINAGSRETYGLIHGYDEWDKVIDNVRFVSDYRKEKNLNISLFISSVVTDITSSEKEEFRETFGEISDEIMFVNCDNQQGYMLANEGGLYSHSSENLPTSCNLPFNRLHVTSEGYLSLCCVDYQNYLAVADLNKVDLYDAWNNDHFISIRKKHIEDKLMGTLCENCLKQTDGDISPLCMDLSTTMDFPDFYKKSSENMKVEFKNRKQSLEFDIDLKTFKQS